MLALSKLTPGDLVQALVEDMSLAEAVLATLGGRGAGHVEVTEPRIAGAGRMVRASADEIVEECAAQCEAIAASIQDLPDTDDDMREQSEEAIANECASQIREFKGRFALPSACRLDHPHYEGTCPMIVCQEIRKVAGGYIVEVRHPYHDEGGMGCGEVVCPTFDDVIALLRKAAADASAKDPRP